MNKKGKRMPSSQNMAMPWGNCNTYFENSNWDFKLDIVNPLKWPIKTEAFYSGFLREDITYFWQDILCNFFLHVISFRSMFTYLPTFHIIGKNFLSQIFWGKQSEKLTSLKTVFLKKKNLWMTLIKFCRSTQLK